MGAVEDRIKLCHCYCLEGGSNMGVGFYAAGKVRHQRQLHTAFLTRRCKRFPRRLAICTLELLLQWTSKARFAMRLGGLRYKRVGYCGSVVQ